MKNYLDKKHDHNRRIRNVLAVILVMTTTFSFSQTWTQLNDIGATVNGTAVASPAVMEALCFSVNGKLYVIGSKTFSANLQGAVTWEYDPSSDNWSEKAPYPGQGWYAHCGFVINNQIYAGGGQGQINPCMDFHRYDPATNTWTAIASMNSARAGSGAFAIDGKGYVLCGNGRKDMWQYSPGTNSWTAKADYPGGIRYGLTAFSCGGQGFAGLGYDSNTWFGDFYRYDAATDSWTSSAPFTGLGRSHAQALVLGSAGIITCGNQGMMMFSDAYQFECVSGTWSTLPQTPGFNRSAHIFGNVGNKLYLGGGTGPGGTTPYQDWWTIQSTVGVPENLGNKPLLSTNFSGEKVITFETAPPEGTSCNVSDLQGRLISHEVIRGKEMVLPGELQGLYLVSFEPPLYKPFKVHFGSQP